jgi:NodT family efflux transporter outer membrane factor (OMF) lipoprotein
VKVRALAACGLALTSGCVVGPAYQTPPPPAGATAPLVSVNPASETRAAATDDWWRLYSDPKLDGYVREAVGANTDLAAAQAHLGGARAILEAARGGLYPSANVKLGGVYGRDAVTDEILEITGSRPQTTWLYDDILDVSYELDLFGRVRRSIEAARANTAAAAAARDAVKITVVAETARAYGQICALGEQLAVANRSLEVVSREAQITANRRDAGAGSDFDVVRAQGLAAQVRATIPPLEGQRRAALFQLTALLGRTPANAPTEALACVAPLRLVAPIPVGDGEALIRRRPDVRQAERQLAAATARIGVAVGDLYPRISLVGLYGGAAAHISDLTNQRGLTWGVGPSISWTFPNQTEPRARIHEAKAAAAAALAQFDGTVLQALKETETALSGYDAELNRRDALAEARDKAHIAFEDARGQYLAGSLSTLDLLAAEQSMVTQDAAVAASDGAILQDQISIFKALGGGWQPSSG